MAKSIILNALDIGTGSIKVLVGQKDLGTQDITILGQTQALSFGVRKGEISNPQEVSQGIVAAKEHLQKSGAAKIKKVLVNIAGSHLYSLQSQGLVSVSRADQKISKEDIQRVLQASRALNLPSNKEVLNVFAKEFVVDGEGGIEDPLGLEGIRLEAKVLLVCAFSPVLENLGSAVTEADLEIEEVIPSPLASARACLTPQQKELGVGLVDIGAGNTGVSFFETGKLIDFAIFPLGSANITNDIAIGLRTEIVTAERIKKEFGTLSFKKRKKKGSKIEIPEKSLSFSPKFLKDIIEARVSEIFSEVQKELKKISKQNLLPGGIVLTGGGSFLPGIVEFAKHKLKLPCRLGPPRNVPGIEDLAFSTCCGLLLSGFDSRERGRERVFEEGMGAKLRKLFKMFLP
ncbi:cell division protein FtsA [Patescibacteria group bacterium]|nr:cell division protein FtsA [Patescibacteria group bacterium]